MKKGILIMAAAAFALTLTACGSSQTTAAQTTAAQTKESTAETTVAEASTPEKETRTVRLVTAGVDEPPSLIHNDGTWTGIDAEMWAEIEKRTGWTIELNQAPLDGVFGQLDAGRADVAANCWAVRAERVEKYYASIPYYGDAQTVCVAQDSDINTLEDLKGKRIGVTSGQACQALLEGLQDQYGFELVVYDQAGIGYKEVELGRLDAMGGALMTFNAYVANNGETLRLLDERLAANNIAYFFPKTDEGAALRDEVNQVVQEMLDDGTVSAITEKWLGSDMTKAIVPDQN
jgi:ABC-type amino acid transport substrate-binding protein